MALPSQVESTGWGSIVTQPQHMQSESCTYVCIKPRLCSSNAEPKRSHQHSTAQEGQSLEPWMQTWEAAPQRTKVHMQHKLLYKYFLSFCRLYFRCCVFWFVLNWGLNWGPSDCLASTVTLLLLVFQTGSHTNFPQAVLEQWSAYFAFWVAGIVIVSFDEHKFLCLL
jgi:hypothetical protein